MNHDALLTTNVRVFALCVLLAFMGWVVRLIRLHRLSLRESLLWFLSTGAAAAVTVYPPLLGWVAGALQIELPSNALFALTFVYVLANLLALTLGVSSNTTHVRRLAQECALLRAEVDALRVAGGTRAGPGAADQPKPASPRSPGPQP